MEGMTRSMIIILGAGAVAVLLGLTIAGVRDQPPPQSGAAAIMTVNTAAAPTATSTSAFLPKAEVKSALSVATTTATLRGTVNGNGAPTTYWFEYSSDPELGAVLIRTTPRIALSTTTENVAVLIGILGLTPSTTYYFRLAASNEFGTVRSDPLSFLTK